MDADQQRAQAWPKLVRRAFAIRRALAVRDDVQVPVSYSGGVFDACPQVTAAFTAALAASGQRYAVVAPRHAPEVGAALYAARLAGGQLAISG